uniref:Ig-like domain-containing protein n=1 Tax=Amphiprion percula TaxID=161767 RepID=A0A3P8TGK5_AMPPE
FFSLSLFLSGKAQFSDISQPDSFQAVKLGDKVIISCFISNSARNRVWYKLTTERKLQLVASVDTMFNEIKFEKQFRHFSAISYSTNSHLIISRTAREDTGTYYCGVMKLQDVQFGQGTFLMIKGAKMISDYVVKQPQSHSAQSGDPVTLRCSVQFYQCDAEHTSVTWLKNSDHSAPEMIYTSGNHNSSCHTVSGESTCVYNLLMRNLSYEDAGVYHCVVTACGQILFGNGTRIKIHNAALNKSLDVSPGVTALILSNVIFGVVTLVLVWKLCKNHKKVANTDPVIYAAVTSVPRISSCQSAPVKHDTDMVIYSGVKCSQRD